MDSDDVQLQCVCMGRLVLILVVMEDGLRRGFGAAYFAYDDLS